MSESAISDIATKSILMILKPKLQRIIKENMGCLLNPQQSQSHIAMQIISAIYDGTDNKEYKEIIGLAGNMVIVTIEKDQAFREKFDDIMWNISQQYNKVIAASDVGHEDR